MSITIESLTARLTPAGTNTTFPGPLTICFISLCNSGCSSRSFLVSKRVGKKKELSCDDKKNDAVGTKYVLNSVAIFFKMVMDHLHFKNMIYNRGRKKAVVPELVMRAGRFF